MGIGDSFHSVLAAAQEGAPWAWRVLYAEYAGKLRGYLSVRGSAEPDDLVGEVFLQLARHIQGFVGEESQFRSWLFQIAHNRLVDERRRRARSRVTYVELSDLDVLDERGDVEAKVLEGLGSQWVAELLAELSPDQREILALRVVAGLSVAETANVVGKGNGAVRALQHRAVRALRRKMAAKGITR